MKSLFSKFKRGSQRETKVVCSNLTVANNCRLVSEIKNYQTRLDAIELEIKALERPSDNIPACVSLFNNRQMRFVCGDLYWYNRPVSIDIVADALCNALGDINLNELIEELTMLYNKEITLASKKNEAIVLREKIDEAKNALGIK